MDIFALAYQFRVEIKALKCLGKEKFWGNLATGDTTRAFLTFQWRSLQVV